MKKFALILSRYDYFRHAAEMKLVIFTPLAQSRVLELLLSTNNPQIFKYLIESFLKCGPILDNLKRITRFLLHGYEEGQIPFQKRHLKKKKSPIRLFFTLPGGLASGPTSANGLHGKRKIQMRGHLKIKVDTTLKKYLYLLPANTDIPDDKQECLEVWKFV